MAKPGAGKVNRVTVDFGPLASLMCGWLVNLVKAAWVEEPMIVREKETWFVGHPDVQVLSEHFAYMESDTRGLVYSDDASVSLRCNDGMLWVNLDITSCDSSNGPAVFHSLLPLVPESYRHLLQVLIKQCQSPISLGCGRGRLLMRPREIFEYSGSLLTTILNNSASFAIMLQVMLAHDPLQSRATNRHRVSKSLEGCGWKVTAEWCENFEDLQFLKHSPARLLNGGVRAILNLGVILRSMGRTDGDYAGSGPLLARIAKHNAAWVSGLAHAGNTGLLRALKDRWPPNVGRGPRVDMGYVVSHTTAHLDNELVSEHSVARRYRLEPAQLEELYWMVSSAQIGDMLHSDATDAILEKDYGLPPLGQ